MIKVIHPSFGYHNTFIFLLWNDVSAHCKKLNRARLIIANRDGGIWRGGVPNVNNDEGAGREVAL